MAIEAKFSNDESLKGFVHKRRREVLTALLGRVPAEIKDAEGQTVPMTIERVAKNVYWVEVSIQGFNSGRSQIQINDSEKVELLPSEHGYRPRLVYDEPVDNPKKYAMKSRSYSFIIVEE